MLYSYAKNANNKSLTRIIFMSVCFYLGEYFTRTALYNRHAETWYRCFGSLHDNLFKEQRRRTLLI